MPYSYPKQTEIEEAFKFLALSFQQRRVRNRNKPVVLHSIRVGMYLYRLDYPKNVVIAGILHDLLEDTDVSFNDLKDKFGDNIACLVQACSFDASIRDKKEQYDEVFARCLKEGKEALLVKIVDLVDNLPYMLDVKYAGDLRDFLQEKIRYFIELARPKMTDEALFQELTKQFDILSTRKTKN
jgi:(p)ppGpp synthase/HD superfamily hydrolase